MSYNTESCPETVESAELILQNVSILSELSSHLIKETRNGENSVNSLNNLIFQAGKDLSSIHHCVNSLLIIAKKLVHLSLQIVPIKDPNFKSLKIEADKLLSVLDEVKDKDEDKNDGRWRGPEKVAPCKGSLKCLAEDKYPERCSRESLLDISNVVNLPTVPEDAFANFHRPSRTLSSCSLKNLRKVKLCLQKAACYDAEEEFDHPTANTVSPVKYFEPMHANTQTMDIPNTRSAGTDACTTTELPLEGEGENYYQQN